MRRRHWGQHDDTCFACRVQSVRLSPAATPSRMNTVAPAEPKNHWEQGIVTEPRPGGFEMPVVKRDGSHIGVKEWANHRGRYDRSRDRARNDPQSLGCGLTEGSGNG